MNELTKSETKRKRGRPTKARPKLIDFWSLVPGHNAFCGRGNSLAALDECAFVRNLTETIAQNLMPALAQYELRI